MAERETYHHRVLDCGVEYSAVELPGRRTTSFQIRVLAGLVDEPPGLLGLARVVQETIGKGTEKRSARQLSDAFDQIGAQWSSGVGRESIVFRCSCLPEFAEEALALHAEMLRTPTFPEEFCRVAVELGLQELTALEDEPGELAHKLIAPHAFGELLGRHELGAAEMLRRVTRDDICAFWREHFAAAGLQVCIGGVTDVDRFAERVEGLFGGFGRGRGRAGPNGHPLEFSPGAYHHEKELEQEHVLICWPGVSVRSPDYSAERVMLAVLGGGMSSRLFSEVREKQGLVYWVDAWAEHPRAGGMIFMGASTTPARCATTKETLLREVDRLAEDVTEEELERAKIGIIAKTQTHGDITRARLGELSGDLFQHGRPVPLEEKNAKVQAVTVQDIRRYLDEHPRDALCVLTLGPAGLPSAGD